VNSSDFYSFIVSPFVGIIYWRQLVKFTRLVTFKRHYCPYNTSFVRSYAALKMSRPVKCSRYICRTRQVLFSLSQVPKYLSEHLFGIRVTTGIRCIVRRLCINAVTLRTS